MIYTKISCFLVSIRRMVSMNRLVSINRQVSIKRQVSIERQVIQIVNFALRLDGIEMNGK
jgi:hypothetical protein